MDFDDMCNGGRKRKRASSERKPPLCNARKCQKVNTSLKVCKKLHEDCNMKSLLPKNDQSRMNHTVDCNMLNLMPDQPKKSQGREVNSALVTSSPCSAKVLNEPEFCPLAVVKYYIHTSQNHKDEKKKWELKAKKHLMAEGWILDYLTPKRKTILYKSPKNLTLFSLQGACRRCIKESIPKWIPSKVSVTNEESVNDLESDDLVHCVTQLVQKEPDLLIIDKPPSSVDYRSHTCVTSSKPSSPKNQRNESPPIQLQLSTKHIKTCLLKQKRFHKDARSLLHKLLNKSHIERVVTEMRK